MLISMYCENMLSLVNELRLVNRDATSETFPTMLNEVLAKRGLDKILGSKLEQG